MQEKGSCNLQVWDNFIYMIILVYSYEILCLVAIYEHTMHTNICFKTLQYERFRGSIPTCVYVVYACEFWIVFL